MAGHKGMRTRRRKQEMGILESERVRLRPIGRFDLEILNRWKNDEAVYKNLGGGFLPVSIDIQEKWMDSLMDTTGNHKRFMIDTAQDGTVGMVGLYDINWIHRTCELGILIGETGQQGKGYGKEAYLLLESYGRRYLNLRKVTAKVVRTNETAVSMYRKLGFEKAGCLTMERFIDGKYHDLFIMEKFWERA